MVENTSAMNRDSGQNTKPSEPISLIGQLKRRKVFQVTSVYAVAAWGAILGAAELFPSFGLSDEHVKWFVYIAIGLIPVVALLAWLYELTPKGIVRDPEDVEAPTIMMTATVPAASSTQLTITWRGEVHRFHSDVHIGRDPRSELHLDDPQVSRHHAEIVFHQGRWLLRDLGSRNGTRLNGELIGEAYLAKQSRVDLYDGGMPITISVG